MGWSGFPIQEGDDWTRLDVVNQLFFAHFERAQVTGAGYYNFQFTPGSDLQRGGRSGSSNVGWRLVQQQLYQQLGQFGVTPAPEQHQGETGIFSFWWGWTFSSGLEAWPRINDSLDHGAGGFTRKYPREIADPSAAGEPGQRARSKADGLIYDHTGGMWALSEDQLQPPDTVTAYGYMEAGDYIGPWIFNELYAMLNLMHTRYTSPSFAQKATWSGSSNNSPNYPFYTREDAVAAAIADWQDRGVSTSSSAPNVYTSIGVDYWGAQWTATIARRVGTYRYPISSAKPSMTRLFYAPGPAGDGNSWSNQGDNIPQGDWYTYMQAYEGPLTAADDIVVGDVPVSTMPTDWYADRPADGWHVRKGWVLGTGTGTVLGATTYIFDYNDGLPGGGVV